MLNHNYIGTEHVLLGLIHEGEGVAAQALAKLGISLEAVRTRIEEVVGHGQQAPSGHIPFTPRAKKCLELSLREALQLGHNYIGTEHVLLGVIREGEGVGCQVLAHYGAELTGVRRAVIELLLSGYQGKKVAESGTRTLSEVEVIERQIFDTRRLKESAIDAQDFEKVERLREHEKYLIQYRKLLLQMQREEQRAAIVDSLIALLRNYGVAITDELVADLISWRGADVSKPAG